MKALSVVHPWGEKIGCGEKSLEIRSWLPDLLPQNKIALVENSIRLLEDGQQDENGYVVAVIDIISCKPWTIDECAEAGCDQSQFSIGYFSWKIGNVQRLNKPVKVIAKRKLYNLSSAEALSVQSELMNHCKEDL